MALMSHFVTYPINHQWTYSNACSSSLLNTLDPNIARCHYISKFCRLFWTSLGPGAVKRLLYNFRSWSKQSKKNVSQTVSLEEKWVLMKAPHTTDCQLQQLLCRENSMRVVWSSWTERNFLSRKSLPRLGSVRVAVNYQEQCFNVTHFHFSLVCPLLRHHFPG